MIPRYLYKYRSINEHTIQNLTNNEIWFSNPTKNDDPYDCSIYIERGHITINDAKDLLNNLKDIFHIPDEACKALLEKYATNGNPKPELISILEEEGKNSFDKARKEILYEWGVSCFSEIFDDQHMWALYADKHSGICLEFDTHKLFRENPTCAPQKVRYQEKIPKVNIVEILKEKAKGYLRDMITIKANCWSYQKEWRYFVELGNKNYQYQPNALTGVYFGLRTPESDRDEIIDLLRKENVNFYEMVRNEDIYKFDRKAMEI